MPDEVSFHCPLQPDDLKFRSLAGREELGRLPEFRVELLRSYKLEPVKADALLGKGAGVTIMLDNQQERHLHGIVTEFERCGVSGRNDIYRLVLRPWLWQLTLGADCRIFQDKTVIQILDIIFAEYGSAGRVEKKVEGGSFASRPYTVQYRESDFDFVSRLMEEEGIYYYFKHEESQHTLVLCNSPSGHGPIPGGSLDWSAEQTGNTEREDIVTEWSRSHSLQPLRYTHTDFAAEAPRTDLQASAQRAAPYAKPNELEVFDYPGGHDDFAMGENTGGKTKAGKDSAQLEINRFESRHSVATALTPFRGLTVGSTFSFKSHPDKDGYLVTSTIVEVRFSGNESNTDERRCDYLCRFNAVPKTVAFLPGRSVTRPVIGGPQTATVVGPSGDEIHTDKYGRVKLQFHWDRVGKNNEKSSCWVRVSYPSAGKNFGSLSLPRIGEEVVVDFLEGNPDRPLVTGRVYNGENLPPYPLPRFANVSGMTTRSTKSGGTDGNELLFFDDKGKELVSMRAQYNQMFQVLNDFSTWVGKDAYETIGGNRTSSTGVNLDSAIGANSTLKIGADSQVAIGGDLISSVGGALSTDVTGSFSGAIGSAAEVAVGTGLDLNVGTATSITTGTAMNLKALSVVIEGSTEISLKVGSSFITLTPAGVTIQGALVNINPGGAAGPAQAAAKATPPKPKDPGKPADYKNPLGR